MPISNTLKLNSNKWLRILAIAFVIAILCSVVFAGVPVGATSAATITIATEAAADIGTTSAVIRGNVTDTGGSGPVVTMYWGTTDGGQVALLWDNSGTATYAGGVAAFYLNISSLTAGQLYYFSASADNTGGGGGVSWASASKSFTTTASGVDDSYTKLLLHMDGANNSTTFTDEAGESVTRTNAIISTTKSEFGGASGYFNGSSKLNLPDGTNWAFGTSAFTIDCWFYMSDVSGNHSLIDTRSSDSDTGLIMATTDTHLRIYTASQRIIGATTLVINTWYHAAVIGNGGANGSRTVILYLNGTQEGSTWTFDYNFTNQKCQIGQYYGNGEGWSGYIDELRVSKGIARWTSNFTPPTQEYAPAGSGVPTVTTSATTSISTSGGTLNGSVTVINDTNITDRGFVYGLSSHGNPGDVAPASAGYTSNWTESGTWSPVPVAITKAITGYTQGQTVYFRACAQNDANHWGYSAESSFTTLTGDLYWYGGSGSWSDYTNHWSQVTGDSPHTPALSAPTSTTNVHFDANSFTAPNQIVTFPNGNNSCNNIDWTGAIGNPVILCANGNPHIQIYGSLTLIPQMSFGNSGIYSTTWIDFLATSSVTVNFAGLDPRANTIDFNGVGGTWTLTGNLISVLGAGNITLTTGTLDTAGYIVTCNGLSSSNTNTRALTFSTSVINTGSWDTSIPTNLTYSGTSATINDSGNFYGGGLTFNTVNLTSIGSPVISGSNTFTNLTRTGTATQTDSLTLTAGTTQTVTGTFTANGNSATNRLLVRSSSAGSSATITANGTISASNVDFWDITGAGSASWDLHLITGGTIGFSGCTGITCTYPYSSSSNLYWYGDSGSWTDNSDLTNMYHWSTASGGTGGQRHQVPTALNNVYFDAGSFTTTSQTIGIPGGYVAYCKDMDWAGTLHNPTFSIAPMAYDLYRLEIFGSLKFITGMLAGSSSNCVINFESAGAATIDLAGRLTTSEMFLQFDTAGTWTLQNDLVVSSTATYAGIAFSNGDLITNNYNITAKSFAFSNSYIRTLTLGSSTITLGIGGWNVSNVTNLTFTANTATINDAGNFYGGGLTYGTVNLTGSATATVSGNNAGTTFSIARATRTVHFTAGSTQTFTTFSFPTSGATVLTMNSTSGGSAWNLVQTSGTVSTDYLALTDSHASGGAIFYAGLNSTVDPDNNTGWIFNLPLPATVTTVDATLLQLTSAQLNGNLVGFGSYFPVDVYFHYGIDPALAAYTSTAPKETMVTTGTFDIVVTNLVGGTAYYFQAVANDGSSDVFHGSILTFSTLGVGGGGGGSVGSILEPQVQPNVVQGVTGGSGPSVATVNQNIPLVGIAIFVATFINVTPITVVNIGAIFIIFALGFCCLFMKLGPVVTGIVMCTLAVMFNIFHVFDFWQVFMFISFIILSWMLPRQTAMIG